jgi:hypothetical protein
MSASATKVLVLYHSSCVDGFTAAWSAWDVIRDEGTYLPCQHGVEPPWEKIVAGNFHAIYILDFCFSPDVLRKMSSMTDDVIIIDHHVSSKKELGDVELPSNVEVNFDMTKSGARMAWEYFHEGKEVPKLVRYVEDRDLWKFTEPKSEAVNAWIFSQFKPGKTFGEWSLVRDLIDSNFPPIMEAGEGMLSQKKILVEIAFAFAVEVEFDGVKVLSNNTPSLISEVGHALCEPDGREFSIVYYQRFDPTDGGWVWQYSLRSTERPGQPCADVSVIAKKYGGGGHARAAGFISKDFLLGKPFGMPNRR